MIRCKGVCAAVSKRAVLLLISVCLVLSASVSGTLAFLNGGEAGVMTTDRVEILQLIQQRDASGQLVPVVQDAALLPAVYEGDAIPLEPDAAQWPQQNPAWQTLAANSAVIDKFVTVTNLGTVPAYVRTLVALESPGAAAGGSGRWVHLNHNDASTGQIEPVTLVQDVWVGDTLFDVYRYTYQNPLKPGDTTIPSLKQLYMDKTCTNGDMALIGSRYEVLALSQGVEAAGFDNAADAFAQTYGEPTADQLATWLAAVANGSDGSEEDGNTPITVSNMEELNAALAAVPPGGSVTLVLAANPTPYTAPANATGKRITLQGTQGAVLQMVTHPDPTGPSDPSFAGSHLRLVGLTVIGAKSAVDQGFACASLEMEDCTIRHNMYLFAPASFTHCAFTDPIGTRYHIETNGQSVSFTGCSFTTYGKAVHVSSPSATHATVQASDCTFTDQTGTGVKNPVFVVDEGHSGATCDLILSTCTATGFETDSGTQSPLWNNKDAIPPARLSVTIDGVRAY